MSKINLMPWRKDLLVFKRRQYFAIVMLLGVITTVGLFFMSFLVKAKTLSIKQDFDLISRETIKLERQIKTIKGLQEKKEKLLTRREVIESLQSLRTFAVIIFDNVVRTVPSGLVLEVMERKEDDLILSGFSESNSRISILMRNLQKLPWVNNAEITEIKTLAMSTKESSDAKVKFTLQLELNYNKVQLQGKETS